MRKLCEWVHSYQNASRVRLSEIKEKKSFVSSKSQRFILEIDKTIFPIISCEFMVCATSNMMFSFVDQSTGITIMAKQKYIKLQTS